MLGISFVNETTQPPPQPTGGLFGIELREETTRPVRTQKKAMLPNGKTLSGFTKQFTCRAPEPISPTGTKAPKSLAAMLRVASTAGDSLRFMGTIKRRPRRSFLSMNTLGILRRSRRVGPVWHTWA